MRHLGMGAVRLGPAGAAFAAGLAGLLAWAAPAAWARPDGPPASAEGASEEKKEPVRRDRRAERRLKEAIVVAATAEGEDVRKAAEAEIRAAEPHTRHFAYELALAHGLKKVREYAVRGILDADDIRPAVPPLMKRLAYEPDRELRLEITRRLRPHDTGGMGVLLVPYLSEKSPHRRFRALMGLGTFRDRRAVPRLIEHLHLTVAGFPRAAVSFTTQRAYIRGWQLVSGGTGLTVVEVPDPEVDVLETGVAMDVKVARVEISMTVEALETLTGQTGLGKDVDAWTTWYMANRDFELPPVK